MNLQFKKNLKISLVFMVLLFLNLIAYFCIRYFTSYLACRLIVLLIVVLLIFIIIKNKKYIKESNEKFRDIIKNVIIPVLIVLVTSVLIIKIYDTISNNNTLQALFSINASGENFKLDTNNRYLVITDSKQLTYQSDGGSNYNVYYEIDLDKNIIKN